MINLAFMKSKLFIASAVVLVFVLFTYKVYDTGYGSAVHKLSMQAVEAKEKHDNEVKELEESFAKMEREFLEEERETKIEFDKKYETAMGLVDGYVKDNGYTNCNIGTNGVHRINDLLKGSTSNDK